ncbi:MAG: glycoside hydrolase family 9 protein [Myxococcales bacterium]
MVSAALALLAAVLGAPAGVEEDARPMLAASQVGYGPAMDKQFTSPRPFTSFRVVSLERGEVAYRGKLPIRRVESEVLGPAARVWIGDFSALRRPGRYRIEADNGLSSHPFSIGTRVFDPAVRAVQRAFYFQRAFTAIDPRHAEGPWTHPSDADRAPPGVVKGWHDAGDLTLYNASTTAALFWMLEAFSDFAPSADDTNIPESGNGVPDLLDEARWGLEWLLSVQEPRTGGFRNTTCQERYAPYGTVTPQSVPRYRQGEVGTLATARAVGTLAYASAVFRPIDPVFAQRCLQAARDGWGYLQAHPGESTDGPTCPNYRRDGDQGVLRHVTMYAAAGLLLATGEARFREEFERSYVELTFIPDYHQVNGFAARLYLRAKAGDPGRKRAIRARLRALADQANADGARHPFEWASYYYWGSLSNSFHRTGTFEAPLCLAGPRHSADCRQALANVHYALGRNSLHFCYVSGLPGVEHGMRHGFHHWLQALGAAPRNFPGMVAGGPSEKPDANDRSWPDARPPSFGYWGDPKRPRGSETPVDARYTDNDSWSTNEIAVNFQAAALYGLYLAQALSREGAR